MKLTVFCDDAPEDLQALPKMRTVRINFA